MSGGSPQPVTNQTAAMLQAYTANLPQLLQSTANQSGPIAQALQNTSNTIEPQNAALQSQLYGTYAPQLANTGNLINQITSQGGINTANQNVTGAGGTLATNVQNLDKTLNPLYYQTQANAGAQANNLLNSIDLSGLSGSERAEVQRSNAQQDAQRGILNSPSQTATVQNAMQFGTALQAKRNALSSAISTATSFLPSAKSGIDTTGLATGTATNTANPGTSQFAGAGPSGAAQAQTQNNNLASGLLGATSSANTTNTQAAQASQYNALGAMPSF